MTGTCPSSRDAGRRAAVRNNDTAARARLAAAVQRMPPAREAAPMLTAQEAADRLGVSVRQLNRYQTAGLITPVQNVRRGRRWFTEQSVEDLRRNTTT